MRRPRTYEARVSSLESRDLLTLIPVQFSVSVRPAILPPNGAYVPVAVSGVIAGTRPDVHDAFFQVTDEYRRVEPAGPVAITPIGVSGNLYRYSFDFTVHLQASARSNTASGGRQYYILVGASDADNTDGKTVAAFVPTSPPPPTVHVTAALRTPAGPRPRPFRRPAI